MAWPQVPVPQLCDFPDCVASGKSLGLSVLQSPQLQDEDSDSACLMDAEKIK